MKKKINKNVALINLAKRKNSQSETGIVEVTAEKLCEGGEGWRSTRKCLTGWVVCKWRFKLIKIMTTELIASHGVNFTHTQRATRTHAQHFTSLPSLFLLLFSPFFCWENLLLQLVSQRELLMNYEPVGSKSVSTTPSALFICFSILRFFFHFALNRISFNCNFSNALATSTSHCTEWIMCMGLPPVIVVVVVVAAVDCRNIIMQSSLWTAAT